MIDSRRTGDKLKKVMTGKQRLRCLFGGCHECTYKDKKGGVHVVETYELRRYSDEDICSVCDGEGDVEKDCPHCDGWGKINEPCDYCEGDGNIPDEFGGFVVVKRGGDIQKNG